MPQIDISHDLFQQIQQTLPASGTVDSFVHEAIKDKLAWQQRRDEFFRLSGRTRQAMLDRGLTEEAILAEVEAQRRARSAG